MKRSKELTEILNELTNQYSSPTPLNLIIKILEKYYSENSVEDPSLVLFITENLFPRERLLEIINRIKAVHGEYYDKFTVDALLDTAALISNKYSKPSWLKESIVTCSHVLLAAIEEFPVIRDIMGGEYIKENLIRCFSLNTDLINSMVDKVMNTLFPKKNSAGNNDEDSAEDFLESIGFPLPGGEEKDNKTEDNNTDTPMLSKYAREITNSKLDPVYGRESELLQLLEILGCKKKNNAILVGEPGVGKTAVVELLAQRITEKKVPKQFLGKKIYSLDLNSLVAGTKYRGQYEERLQGLIEEVVSHPEVIIFIDEIHNLIGNGGSEGNGDAANILKPYLAKGMFQCIGSTTFKEYRKFIEKDGALKRRFQNVRIDEPTAEETLKILSGIKDVYESHHNVTYPKETLEACVKLSGRYLPDRYFPDKAIDALDLSGSLTRLTSSASSTDTYLATETEMLEWQQKKISQTTSGDLDSALTSWEEEKKAQKKLTTKDTTIKVSIEDVCKAIGKRSGVPLESISSSDLDKLRRLSQVLPAQVIGQEKAIKEVVMSLQRNSLSLRDPQKPIASLLFVGPTGSGKTYLCKTLAKEFFGTEDALIMYNMSEYGEKHEVTKLMGAAASYIGYDDEPGFEAIRKKPYSVVLFDEIEKAAPEVYQIFLSILDDGIVTLSNGTKVNFKNTIIIFTGNIGTKELSLFGSGLGYGNSGGITEERKDNIISGAIKKTFAPEFINRLSKIVIFQNLGKKELTKIVDLELTKLCTRLKESKITIKVTKALKEFIISQCDTKYGARDLQRGITKNVEEVLCEKLLSPDIPEGKKIFTLDYTKDSGVTIELKDQKKNNTQEQNIESN